MDGIDPFSMIIIILLFFILPMWLGMKVLKRAGYSPWWALLLLIPFVGLILIWFFAFGKWPVREEARRRMRQADDSQGGSPQSGTPQSTHNRVNNTHDDTDDAASVSEMNK